MLFIKQSTCLSCLEAWQLLHPVKDGVDDYIERRDRIRDVSGVFLSLLTLVCRQRLPTVLDKF